MNSITKFERTISTVSTVDHLVGYFTTKRGLAKLADEGESKKVAEGLASFAALDNAAMVSQLAMGHIAYEFLQLPIDQQQPIVEAIAVAMGIKAPSYEGVATGRLQLAHTIYGRLPELCKLKRGDKDTLAGKRLSECMRLYKVANGLTQPTGQKKTDGPSVRLLRGALGWLWSVAESESEQEILTELFARLGVDDEKVEEWLATDEQPEVKGKKAA